MAIETNQPDYTDLNRLGPVIFRQRQDYYLFAEICVISIMHLAGLVFIVHGLFFADWEVKIAATCEVLPILLTCWCLNRRLRVFQYHEKGVSLKTWYGDRGLLFEEIDSFQYKAVRYIFQHTVVLGTSIKLKFVPNDRSSLKGFSFRGNIETQPAAMESMQVRVSDSIAKRLACILSEELSVRWTSMVTLEQKGIQFKPRISIIINRPVFLAYEDIARTEMHEGYFNIYRPGKKWPALSIPIGTPNFFPGLMIFNMIIQKINNLSEEQ